MAAERLFVDTSFLLALLNQRDHYHPAAVRLSAHFSGVPRAVEHGGHPAGDRSGAAGPRPTGYRGANLGRPS